MRWPWADPALLREMIRLRIVYSLGLDKGVDFEEAWLNICISHYDNEHSAQYLIDRCMMRPRFLLELVQQCISHAVNVGNTKIQDSDIRIGLERFSSQLMQTIGFELRDILFEAEDYLYNLVGFPRWVVHDQLVGTFEVGSIPSHKWPQLIEYLLWYGVIGIVRDNNEEAYIYNVFYDMKRLKQLVSKAQEADSLIYCINPSLEAALELQDAV